MSDEQKAAASDPVRPGAVFTLYFRQWEVEQIQGSTVVAHSTTSKRLATFSVELVRQALQKGTK